VASRPGARRGRSLLPSPHRQGQPPIPASERRRVGQATSALGVSRNPEILVSYLWEFLVNLTRNWPSPEGFVGETVRGRGHAFPHGCYSYLPSVYHYCCCSRGYTNWNGSPPPASRARAAKAAGVTERQRGRGAPQIASCARAQSRLDRPTRSQESGGRRRPPGYWGQNARAADRFRWNPRQRKGRPHPPYECGKVFWG
jgi:hypothetical protein